MNGFADVKDTGEPVRFTLCPVHQPRETGQNYLGRVTAFFGCRTPKEFCRDYNLDLRGIHHGEPDALHDFAIMTGADPRELIKWTPRRIRRGLMMLNGEILETRINPRHVVRMCPCCAMDDIAANPGVPLDQAVIGRAEWAAAVVDGCLEHRVELISHRGPSLDLLRLDPGYQTSQLLDDLNTSPPVATTVDDFQLYFLSRLGIIPAVKSPLLDDISLSGVAQICGAAGRDMLRYSARTGDPSEKERRAAGFELLGRGPEHIESILLDMRRNMRTSQRAKTVFQHLLEALNNHSLEPQWAGFVDCIVNILFRNLPYPKGSVLLGRTCLERSLLDFASAQQTYGIRKHHLRAFLAGSPQLSVQPFKNPHDALIRIDVANRLFLGRTPFIDAAEVARKLGRHPRLATAELATFSNAGIKLHEEGSISDLELPVYSEAAVDRIIASLIAQCSIITREKPDLLWPSRISVVLGMPSEQVWKLIALGSVGQLYILKGHGPLQGLRISLSKVVEAISGLKATMNYVETAKALGAIPMQITALVARGHLSPAPLREGFTTRHDFFDPEVVEQFRVKYISARQTLKLLAPDGNIRTLRRMGLVPAIFVPKGLASFNYATFFLRQDVMNKLS